MRTVHRVLRGWSPSRNVKVSYDLRRTSPEIGNLNHVPDKEIHKYQIHFAVPWHNICWSWGLTTSTHTPGLKTENRIIISYPIVLYKFGREKSLTVSVPHPLMLKVFIHRIARFLESVWSPPPKQLRLMANHRGCKLSFGYSSERLDLFELAGIPSVSSSQKMIIHSLISHVQNSLLRRSADICAA